MKDTIERVEAPSREEFVRLYRNRGKPVIFTDITTRWRASTEWTTDYFKSVAGQKEVTIHFEENGNFFDWYVDDAHRVDRKMKFGEVIDLLSQDPSGRQYYMTEHKLRHVSEDLLQDVDFSDYFDGETEPYEPMLFLGRDTCMPLHYHGKMEAFLCQFHGEKSITMYSPDQYALVYPGAWYQPHPLFSRIDGRQIYAGTVDFEQFPRFKEVRPMEFLLKPGEMLFIPVHWWHLTRVTGYQVSVTHFFKSKLKCWNFPRPGLPVLGRESLLLAHKAVASLKSRFRGATPSEGSTA